MKSNLNLKSGFFLLLFAILMVNCEKEEANGVYTNDSELNTWINSNKKEINDISLEKIASYEGKEQRAIFRALSPENRQRLWVEKFIVLENSTHNDEEKELYNRILKALYLLDFSQSLTENDYYTMTFRDFINEGITKFEWSSNFVNVTFCTFEFYEEGKDDYNIYMTSARPPAGGFNNIPDCNCTLDIGCLDVVSCREVDCVETDFGCGFLLLFDCTELCSLF